MNDMLNIETGNLGPLYNCCATNPAADATQDNRVKFADAQQRRLIPVTTITPVPIPDVIRILIAKREDDLRSVKNNSGMGGAKMGALNNSYAPTSSINPNFHDPRLHKKGPEVASGVGAAGTILVASDEVATQQLMERTRAYAMTVVDGCASSQDYDRLVSTRIRKSAASAAASSSLAQNVFASQAPVPVGSFAQLQIRFGADVNLAAIDEARLNAFTSIGMLSPEEKQTVLNHQRMLQLESGGGIDVGTDLSIFTGGNNPNHASALRTMLKPFEAYMIATLMPETLEEALAYVPTLANYEPLTVEAVLRGLRTA